MFNLREQSSKDFLVRINDVYKRIKLDDIIYLQSEGKYVSLILNERQYIFRSTLKTLEQILPSNFLRAHSSFIINLDKVVSLRNQENIVVLTNGTELAYSRTNKEKILSHFLVG